MGNQNKGKNSGTLGRVAQENAKKNTEYGKMGDQPKDPNIVHEGTPSSNKTGIDRGRWSE